MVFPASDKTAIILALIYASRTMHNIFGILPGFVAVAVVTELLMQKILHWTMQSRIRE